MKKLGLGEGIVATIDSIYRETSNVVKIGENISEKFWTNKGVRQGCPLSPTLFKIYTADLEEVMKKGQDGGITIGREKIWVLMFADDIVIMAETVKDMKQMIKRLERYAEKRNLEVNVEKSKMLVFQKGGGRRKKEPWKWKNHAIEEVVEYKYLGYIFQKNNKDGGHIREIRSKANKALVHTWQLGKRYFKWDFMKRMWLFDKMVKPIIMYGAEVWEYEEKEEIETIQLKYIKWLLGLEKSTPSYIVLEETKRNKLRIETGKRATKYEERIEKSENKLLKESEKYKRKGTKGEDSRRKYYERSGISWEEANRRRQQGENMADSIKERDGDVQMQEQREKIARSKYNPVYKDIMSWELPKYLRAESNRKDRQIIARFRCGSETRGCRYWMAEEERKCRICKKQAETLTHITSCEGYRLDKDIEEFLRSNGEGVKKMKEILKIRRELEKTEQAGVD